jgi:transposase
MKRYIVNLTADERSALDELVGRKRVDQFRRMRALVLLRAADGFSDEDIADEVGTSVATAERVRRRCCEDGLAAALERKPQLNRKARKFDGASEAKLVKLACSSPPDGRACWTLSLLADHMVELRVFDSVSQSSVQRVLKKTNSSRGE